MTQSDPARGDSGLSPTDLALLATPLEFLSEEHLRQRRICAVIDALADFGTVDRAAGESVLRFVDAELTLHMRDEAEDLFPLLAVRCSVDDGIGRVILGILGDLDAAADLLPTVRASLSLCLQAGSDLSAKDGAALVQFSGHVRRHLVTENAILLPIARARLTKRDLQALSRRMRARRGLPPDLLPPDTPFPD